MQRLVTRVRRLPRVAERARLAPRGGGRWPGLRPTRAALQRRPHLDASRVCPRDEASEDVALIFGFDDDRDGRRESRCLTMPSHSLRDHVGAFLHIEVADTNA